MTGWLLLEAKAGIWICVGEENAAIWDVAAAVLLNICEVDVDEMLEVEAAVFEGEIASIPLLFGASAASFFCDLFGDASIWCNLALSLLAKDCLVPRLLERGTGSRASASFAFRKELCFL